MQMAGPAYETCHLECHRPPCWWPVPLHTQDMLMLLHRPSVQENAMEQQHAWSDMCCPSGKAMPGAAHVDGPIPTFRLKRVACNKVLYLHAVQDGERNPTAPQRDEHVHPPTPIQTSNASSIIIILAACTTGGFIRALKSTTRSSVYDTECNVVSSYKASSTDTPPATRQIPPSSSQPLYTFTPLPGLAPTVPSCLIPEALALLGTAAVQRCPNSGSHHNKHHL